jgi:hypothetical protein
MTILSLRALMNALGVVLLFAVPAMADIAEPPPTVPEPATTALLLAGAGMYLVNRWRQK